VIQEILLGAFPSYGMLAEEGGWHSGEEDARWIVDPLDGTTYYAHGLPIFAVSTALDLCYVAAGRLDGYYERGIWARDIAAGSLIIEEAGGKVTDYRGRELDLEGREIVASNGALHPAMTRLTGEDTQRREGV
jgi:fructose-1,6-bisphosphatase/inositol monophosphatase family enzyme